MSEDEKATVLLRNPVGYPQLAARKDDWEKELSGDVQKIFVSLKGDDKKEEREWWRSFLHSARTTRADAGRLGLALRPEHEGGLARVPWQLPPR
jgi:hypothetical protein